MWIFGVLEERGSKVVIKPHFGEKQAPILDTRAISANKNIRPINKFMRLGMICDKIPYLTNLFSDDE